MRITEIPTYLDGRNVEVFAPSSAPPLSLAEDPPTVFSLRREDGAKASFVMQLPIPDLLIITGVRLTVLSEVPEGWSVRGIVSVGSNGREFAIVNAFTRGPVTTPTTFEHIRAGERLSFALELRWIGPRNEELGEAVVNVIPSLVGMRGFGIR